MVIDVSINIYKLVYIPHMLDAKSTYLQQECLTLEKPWLEMTLSFCI